MSKSEDVSEVFLTVCIPTYNRSAELKKTVDQVIAQISGRLEGVVDVLLSDNCSTDDTQLVCEEFAKKCKFITYVRQEENLGFDKNVDYVLRNGNGKYVWVLADDDYLVDSAIEVVVERLRERDVSYLYMDYDLYTDDFQTYVSTSRSTSEGVVYTEDPDEFISTNKFANSFVSVNVYDKADYCEIQTEKYFGSLWVHFFAALEIVGKGKVCCQLGDSLVYQGYEEVYQSRKGAKLFKYVDANLSFAEFVESMAGLGYGGRSLSTGRKFVGGDNLRQVILTKQVACKEFSLTIVGWCKRLPRLTKYFGRRPLYWLRDIPLMLLPAPLVAGLFVALRPMYKMLKNG